MSSAVQPRRYMPYRIDFSARCTGKLIASTKRRISWRFGYPDRQALDEGLGGVDCRGEEHEILVVWSVASGKIQIKMDRSDVLHTTTGDYIVDHTWAGNGNHVIKVVCHASPPMSAKPDFYQYDLFVDGQSFFNMPKVFELGEPRNGSASRETSDQLEFSSTPLKGVSPPKTMPEDEEESCQSTAGLVSADLLEFTPAPPPVCVTKTPEELLAIEQPEETAPVVDASLKKQPDTPMVPVSTPSEPPQRPVVEESVAQQPGSFSLIAHNGLQPVSESAPSMNAQQPLPPTAAAETLAAEDTSATIKPPSHNHNSMVNEIMNVYGSLHQTPALPSVTEILSPEQRHQRPLEYAISAVLPDTVPAEENTVQPTPPGDASPADAAIPLAVVSDLTPPPPATTPVPVDSASQALAVEQLAAQQLYVFSELSVAQESETKRAVDAPPTAAAFAAVTTTDDSFTLKNKPTVQDNFMNVHNGSSEGPFDATVSTENVSGHKPVAFGQGLKSGIQPVPLPAVELHVTPAPTSPVVANAASAPDAPDELELTPRPATPPPQTPDAKHGEDEPAVQAFPGSPTSVAHHHEEDKEFAPLLPMDAMKQKQEAMPKLFHPPPAVKSHGEIKSAANGSATFPVSVVVETVTDDDEEEGFGGPY